MLQHVDIMIGFAVVMLVMSLVVTILVQAVQIVLDLRGRNLVWGVERILKDLGYDQPRAYAEKILAHPSVSGGMRRARAIRSSELALLLARMEPPTSAETQPARLKRIKDWIAKKLGLPQQESAVLQESIREAADEIARSIGAIPIAAGADADQVKQQIEARIEAARNRIEALTQRFEQVLDERVQATKGQVERIKATFDMVMDRATQRYMVSTRWITAVVSLVIAIALQIDTLRIYDQISTDAELRASLVASSGALLQRAESIQADLDAPLATRAIQAMSGLLDARDSAFAGLDTTRARMALANLQDPPPALVRRAEGRSWVRGQTADAEELQPALALYEIAFARVATGQMTNLLGEARALRGGVDDRLRLFQRAGPVRDMIGPERPYLTARVGGVLLSALLLSLGAPFWYNALKSVSSLRPILAQRVEDSESQPD